MTAATCTCGIAASMPGCDARSVALAHEAAAKGSETFSATLQPGCGARLAHDLFEGCKIALFNAAERFRSCPAATVPPGCDAGEWPPARIQARCSCDLCQAIDSNIEWAAISEKFRRPELVCCDIWKAHREICREMQRSSLPPRSLPPPSDEECKALLRQVRDAVPVDDANQAIRAAFAAWAKGGK